MTAALRHAYRGPLTWWVFEENDVLAVTCSREHRSYVLHHVLGDGALQAPDGRMSSMHCGVCNEDLPLQLQDWPSGEIYRGPREERLPPMQYTCARCGTQGRHLSGWGLCNGYQEPICAACFKAVVYNGER